MEPHHTIKDEIAGFLKDTSQSDDITFITIKYQREVSLLFVFKYMKDYNLVRKVRKVRIWKEHYYLINLLFLLK